MPPTVPRPSSSLIVTVPSAACLGWRQQPGTPYNYKVLMVKRVESGSFKSAHVFPGGLSEPADSDKRWQGMGGLSRDKVCAVRELFEETGILAATQPALPPPELRHAIAEARASPQAFLNLFADQELTPRSDLLQVARWLTPRAQKKRFDTQFYMLNVRNSDAFILGQLAGMSAQPSELMQIDWFTPHEALDASRRAEIHVFPPQFYLLKAMSMCTRWQDLHKHCGDMHAGYEPEIGPVEPFLTKRPDGLFVSLLPGDFAYPWKGKDPFCSVLDSDLMLEDPARHRLHRIVLRKADSGGFYDPLLLKSDVLGSPKL